MTVHALDVGQVVLIRGRVSAERPHTVLVELPSATTLGAIKTVEVPIADVYLPPLTDAAAQVAQLLQQRLDALVDISARLTAEIYELGGHAGNH